MTALGVVLAGSGWALAAVLAVSVRSMSVARSERLAQACHELRGPLCAIGLGVELVGTDGNLAPNRARALQLELGRARQALDDLVVAGGVRARAHPTRPALRQVGLGALITESADVWRAAAGERSLQVELPAGGEVFVPGERLRLAQALGNLLANALEHGDGSVVVALRTDGRIARVEICDGGRGLPAPVADLIGSRRRGWSFRSLRIGVQERGHGLRIAAELIHAHGGRLFSAPSDRGARLVLELPRASAVAARRVAG